MADEPRCSQCGAALAARQEYCLECGARTTTRRAQRIHWLWPAAGAALVAAAGAAAAIAAGGNAAPEKTVVALSPLRSAGITYSSPTVKGKKPRRWPQRDGYTVVLEALPAATGQAAAKAGAVAALKAGMPNVGLLDSGKYASLHPGYTIVFSGIYESLDEALAALPRAARRFKNAYAQQITR